VVFLALRSGYDGGPRHRRATTKSSRWSGLPPHAALDQAAVALLESEALVPDGLLTHTMGLTDVPEALGSWNGARR